MVLLSVHVSTVITYFFPKKLKKISQCTYEARNAIFGENSMPRSIIKPSAMFPILTPLE
jgi:hypothetical protein